MKLIIQPETQIQDFIESFSKIFPYIKIVVSTKKEEQKRLYNEELKNKEKLVESIQITPNMEVNELEKIVREYLHESILLYRKSGKMWLETSVTRNWTLEEQNNQAQEMCSFNEINNN